MKSILDSIPSVQEKCAPYESGEYKDRFLPLVKGAIENTRGVVIHEIGTTTDGCKISVILGVLGVFRKKCGFFVAEQFRDGDDAYIKKSLLSEWPLIKCDSDNIEKKIELILSDMIEGKPIKGQVDLLYGKCG